jgi:hypothetical protein
MKRRAYYFGNMYLSSIQQGIQALHCTSEMYLKYNPKATFTVEKVAATEDLYSWGETDKTVVLLNGGDHSALLKINEYLDSEDHVYAWANWNEGDPDLNGAMTCVGIILPARIYESAKELRRPPRYRDEAMISTDLTEWELEFIDILNGCHLAR